MFTYIHNYSLAEPYTTIRMNENKELGYIAKGTLIVVQVPFTVEVRLLVLNPIDSGWAKDKRK